MRGLWSEANWFLDDDALLLPNGHRLKLTTIRQWQEDLLIGQFDLTGKWAGWRIRQQWLYRPEAPSGRCACPKATRGTRHVRSCGTGRTSAADSSHCSDATASPHGG